ERELVGSAGRWYADVPQTRPAGEILHCRLDTRIADNDDGHPSPPAQQLDRRRIPAVAGIVDLRTVADQREQVAARGDLDVLARRGQTVLERQAATRRHRHVHEEVDVVGE